MTAIIISILAALGIGGGVMLASSGGGGGGSSSAVVSTVNPGGSGGGSSGASESGGSAATHIPTTVSNINSLISFNGTNSIQTGGILAAAPASAVLRSKTGNATLTNGRLTMELNVLAPVLVEGNTYTTNETYAYRNGTYAFMSGYAPGTPKVYSTFDLRTIQNSQYSRDTYNGTQSSVITLPSIDFRSIAGTGPSDYYGSYTNMTWYLRQAFLYLGGRQISLQNSDFGYIHWETYFYHADLDSRRYSRKGSQTFYIFDSEKQLRNYVGRYTGNTATFNGNITGEYHRLLSCGNNNSYSIYGNISVILDFNNMTLSGSLSNTISILNNKTFTGQIYNITDTSPNFKFTSISGGYTSLNKDGSFGEGVIVAGDTPNKDEIVGEMSFAWFADGTQHANIAFGAKKN